MEIFLRVSILLPFLMVASAEIKNINKIISEECPLTEYQGYIECVQKIIAANKKEDSMPVEEEEDEIKCRSCDCNECSFEIFEAQADKNCCENCCPFKPCTSKQCCFRTCHSGCTNLACRFSCRKSCIEFIERLKKNSSQWDQSKSNVFNEDALNITTKIHLNNMIDNVNNMSSPIKVNSSNKNDISIENRNQNENLNNIDMVASCNLPEKCISRTTFPFLECSFNETKECGNLERINTLQPTEFPVNIKKGRKFNITAQYDNNSVSMNAYNGRNQIPQWGSPIVFPYPQQKIMPDLVLPPIYENSLPNNYMLQPKLAPQYIPNTFSPLIKYSFYQPSAAFDTRYRPSYNVIPIQIRTPYSKPLIYSSPITPVHPVNYKVVPKMYYQAPEMSYQAPRYSYPQPPVYYFPQYTPIGPQFGTTAYGPNIPRIITDHNRYTIGIVRS